MTFSDESLGKLQERVDHVVKVTLPAIKKDLEALEDELYFETGALRNDIRKQTLEIKKDFRDEIKPVSDAIRSLKQLRRDLWVIATVVCAMLVVMSPSTWPAAVVLGGKLVMSIKDIIKPA